MWTLDGKDVTTDAMQEDNQELLETGGGIWSLSELRVNATMGGHTHVVECIVAGSEIKKKVSFDVQGEGEKGKNNVYYLFYDRSLQGLSI